jgi:hypothetical protein
MWFHTREAMRTDIELAGHFTNTKDVKGQTASASIPENNTETSFKIMAKVRGLPAA